MERASFSSSRFLTSARILLPSVGCPGMGPDFRLGVSKSNTIVEAPPSLPHFNSATCSIGLRQFRVIAAPKERARPVLPQADPSLGGKRPQRATIAALGAGTGGGSLPHGGHIRRSRSMAQLRVGIAGPIPRFMARHSVQPSYTGSGSTAQMKSWPLTGVFWRRMVVVWGRGAFAGD